MNYKITIQYDGTKYMGWQRLPGNNKTIQGKLESVVSRMFDTEIEVIGSGRTDKGVHARMQVANFIYNPDKSTSKQPKEFSTEYILDYFAQYLPEDIAVTSVEEADDRFHSRYNCTSKVYRYSIDNNKIRDVFQNRFRYHIPTPLNLSGMKEASLLFIGKKDFRSFTSMKSKTKSTIREIYSIDFEEPAEGHIDIYYKANGFLYNMVRIITGTLVEVGLGRISAESINQIFDDKTRSSAGYTVPPHGLCLYEVNY